MPISENAKGLIDEFKDPESASRAIFLTADPVYFRDRIAVWHSIREAVSEKFNVRLVDIRCCGSAHIGYSTIKNRDFIAGESDLDIAIISPHLFAIYLDWTISVSQRFSDLSGFARRHGRDTSYTFIEYAGKRGIIRPDLLPFGDYRTNWFGFFENLTESYSTHFSKISAGIYLSESCFALKQMDVIFSLRGMR